MIQMTIKVEGMKCGMCENHICEQIRNHYAVKKVTASRKSAEVIIITREDISREAITGVINSLGYTVSDVASQPYQGKRWPWSRW